MMKLPERSQLPDNLEIPGLYPPRRRRLPNWPIGLWLVVLAVAAIPAIGIPGVVLARYTTSNSGFCLSCHGTGDTPDRSVPSEVHPSFDQVSCVDCHAKPGQVVFEGYVKGFMAEPERVASNCVRCHPTMAQRTDQQGFKFNELGIKIDHKAHLERGATCVTCHSNVAHDLEVPQTNRPRMDSCFTCHSRSDSCTKCHGSSIPQPAPARETVGRRPIEPPHPAGQAGSANTEEGKTLFAKQCSSCHGADGGAIPSAKLNSQSFLEGLGAEGLARSTTEGKGGMPAFGASSGGALSDQQVKAVVDYLLSAVDQKPSGAAPTNLEEGKTLFAKQCASCHGPDGSSIPAAKLNSRSYLEGYGAEALARSTAGGKGGMPALGAAKGGPLSDEQVQAIVAFLFASAK